MRLLPAVLGLTLLACSPSLSAQGIAFGGIALGTTSVKGLTFALEPGSTTPDTEHMKRLQYAERNANFLAMRDGCKLSAQGLDLLVKDTAEIIAELRDGTGARNLNILRLYGVGSSGLGAVCNQDEIVARVQADTGIHIEFLAAPDQTKPSLGPVDPRDRSRSLLHTIATGNLTNASLKKPLTRRQKRKYPTTPL